jgi:hypothetical protein
MRNVVSTLKSTALIVGIASLVMACGAKEAETPEAEATSIAEPHASLGAAANVIGAPPAETSSAPATPKE